MRKFGRTIFGGGIGLPVLTTPVVIPSTAVYALSGTPSVNEGNSGTTNFTFTLTRSSLTSITSTVDWAVTATGANAADFVGGVFPSGQVSFGIGETTKSIVVTVQGDVTVESNEIFTVTISNPQPAGTIVTATATGTIVNDDTAPTPPPPPPSSNVLVAAPHISGEDKVGGILWVDDGEYNPSTTFNRQWMSGPTEPPANPINGQTGLSLQVAVTAGHYVACVSTPTNGETGIMSNTIRIHPAIKTAPVLNRTSASGASPFTYTITYDATVWADDIEHVQYATDLAFTNIIWDATRGLTSAAFAAPFTSDETVDADPAWDVQPPTFTGTYFVRRRVISSSGLVVSPFSDPISNFNIDLTVRIDESASWDSLEAGEPRSKFNYSPDLLSFTEAALVTDDGAYRTHVGRVNFARSGDKLVAEMIYDTAGWQSYATLGFGFDDGSYDWSGNNNVNSRVISENGWKGVVAYFQGVDGTQSYKANGTTTSDSINVNAGQGFTGWQIGDRMRQVYTKSTVTNGVPDNNGTLVVTRIRGGVETAVMTITGVVWMESVKVIFFANYGRGGTLKFTGITNPAIPAGAQEYQ